MSDSSQLTPLRPSWLRVGAYVRCRHALYMGRAFVTFLTDGGFKYHLEKPYRNRAADDVWHTGGEVFALGMDGWEPAEALSSERTAINPAYPSFKAMERDALDAARYRWLRSEQVATDTRYYPFWNEFNAKLCREEKMDSAIDAAMETCK